MLQYIVILLDNTSPSYCHYNVESTECGLMPLPTLKKAIKWSMMENLMIQFVFPDKPLPKEYLDVIDSIDHYSFATARSESCPGADVVVYNGIEDMLSLEEIPFAVSILRLTKKELFGYYESIKSILPKVPRLNITITDIETFRDEDFDEYKKILDSFVDCVSELISNEESVQLNILTDRVQQESINECGAGDAAITLAPDGNFYICPAFYQAPNDSKTAIANTFSVGNLDDGLSIKNQQLYKKDYAFLCCHCDAYQCKRCVWLNRKTTLEVNTPSHEQCVVAHLERNASMELVQRLKLRRFDIHFHDIPAIDYLDPFDVLKI